MDQCPHRLVPLSEGRIDEDGSLMCGCAEYDFPASCIHVPHIMLDVRNIGDE